jgi:glycosyltransferase involved in cell wall biosynthesis
MLTDDGEERRNDPVDMARKLVALLDDPELRQRMGAAGLERVKTVLAWEHEAPRLLAAYEELFKCDTSR